MNNIKFIVDNNSARIYNGVNDSWVCIENTHKNYTSVIEALLSDSATTEDIIDIINKVEELRTFKPTEYSDGALKEDSGNAEEEDTRKPDSWKYTYNGLPIPEGIIAKIRNMQQKGYTWEQCEKFFYRCSINPHQDSIFDLFRFIERYNLTILKNGHFIAYKGVRDDYYDKHSGTFLNTPGSIIEMPREDVAYDPNEACSRGLHVANLGYASNWGDRVVKVDIDPADVVSVPFDCDCQKIRVCRYLVVDDYNDTEELDEGVVTAKGNAVKPKDAIPEVKRGDWTVAEDSMLVKMRKQQTKVDWKAIASMLGRSAEACRKRWNRLG